MVMKRGLKGIKRRDNEMERKPQSKKPPVDDDRGLLREPISRF
jgi:hypothetical protein